MLAAHSNRNNCLFFRLLFFEKAASGMEDVQNTSAFPALRVRLPTQQKPTITSFLCCRR